MSEDEFWTLLRFRKMSGVPGSTEKLPGYCDWFEPKRYFLDGLAPRITGRMGFFSSNAVDHLDFTLFLRHAVRALEEIEWATLIPPDECGGWLLYDKDFGRIEINPSFAFHPPALTPDAASESN
jgi:hypothetical protein